MNSRDHELARFEKKASHYRAALAEAPNCRVLELFPFVWHLERYCELTGVPRDKLRVIDLMSGSGFLALQLYRLGYKCVQGIESCGKMLEGAVVNESFPMHYVQNGDSVISKIKALRPHVIVSLASFHHLISYTDDTCSIVDKKASVLQQRNLIDKCLSALPRSGLLLIGDLVEDNLESLVDGCTEPVSAAWIGKKLEAAGLVNSPLSEAISKKGTVSEVSARIAEHFGFSAHENYSLGWFRTVVDKETKIGHKDVALSRDLIDLLKGATFSVERYLCPWVFTAAAARNSFVLNKFGFSIDQHFTAAQVGARIKQSFPTAAENVLPWNLALLAIQKGDITKRRRFESRMVRILGFIIIVIISAIVARLYFDVYMRVSAEDFLGFSLSFLAGMLVTEIWGYSDTQT